MLLLLPALAAAHVTEHCNAHLQSAYSPCPPTAFAVAITWSADSVLPCTRGTGPEQITVVPPTQWPNETAR